jgi:uncharacterized membrane protein
MNKQEFLKLLSKKLSCLSRQDAAERLNFYSEMIDDRIEDGLSENEAVLSVGSIDEIALQILSEKAQKSEKKRKFKTWEIVLLVLGAPIWFSLLCAAFSVCIALCASLWSVVISLWAAFASFAVCSPAGLIVGILQICIGNGASGFAIISASLFLAGLAIFSFFGCMALTKLTAKLTKTFFRSIFKKKEGAQ